ncbi:MAG: hypothetical protein KKB51_15840 [Candidatus Riflebacteria bacterium]|nr:hypothetical protein [Candidatus Riflebacteria bacterium]
MSEQRTKIIIETDAGRSEQVLRSVQKSLQGVGNEADSAGKKTKDSAGIMDSSFVKTALSAAALGAAVKTAFNMAKEAAEFKELRTNFAVSAASMGQSGDEMINAIKRASKGTVSEFDAMKLASKSLQLGVAKNSEGMGKLVEVAAARGKLMGRSTTEAFDDIVTGIGRMSPLILDNLGIQIPAAFKEMTAGMTDAQKKQALLSMVIEDGARILKAAKGKTDESADAYRRFTTASSDLYNQTGILADYFVGPAVESIGAIITAVSDATKAYNELFDAKARISGTSETYKRQGEAGVIASMRSLVAEAEARREALGKMVTQSFQGFTDYDQKRIGQNYAGNRNASTEEIRKTLFDQIGNANIEIAKLTRDIEKAKADGLKSIKQAQAAEAKKKSTKETDEETIATDKLTDAQKAFNKAQEEASKLIAQSAEAFTTSFGVKTINNLKEAQVLLTAMTVAAGGFSFALKDGTTEAGKLVDEAGKLDKKLEEINNNIAGTLSGAGRNWSAELARLNPENAATGMMNFATGGLFTAAGGSIKDVLGDVKEPLAKTIAEAVQAGFANADFSNLAQTLGSILSSVLSRSLAQSNPIMNAAGGINFGNLGINMAANFAIGKLTGAGGIFGTRKEKFKEQTIQAAADLKSQMGAAWVKSQETSLLPYLSFGNKQDLAAGRYGYNGTQTGYSWDNSGNGWSSAKTKTYNLIDQGASAALKTLTEAIERAEKYNRSVEMGYEVMTAQGQDYKALIEQTAIYQKAAASAYGGESVLNWTDGTKDTADLAEAAHELKIAAIEMARSLGQATADRTSAAAQGFAKYAPWLNSIQMPGNASSGLRVSMRGDGMFSGATSWQDFLQAPAIANMDELTSGQQYDAYSALQNDFADRKISPYLIDMVKQSGSSKYDLEALKYTDSTAYAEKYLEYIEKQMAAYDEVMKRQEQIFDNATKSYEERSQAIQDFEDSQTAYYAAKLEALSAEQAAEEAVKAKQQEANARSAERMESALSLVGEVSQRGDKIAIIQGGDVKAALEELMSRYGDDPGMVATLQALVKLSNDKARWGV